MATLHQIGTLSQLARNTSSKAVHDLAVKYGYKEDPSDKAFGAIVLYLRQLAGTPNQYVIRVNDPNDVTNVQYTQQNNPLESIAWDNIVNARIETIFDNANTLLGIIYNISALGQPMGFYTWMGFTHMPNFQSQQDVGSYYRVMDSLLLD